MTESCVIRYCERRVTYVSDRKDATGRRCRSCVKSMSIFNNMTESQIDDSEHRAMLILARIRAVRLSARHKTELTRRASNGRFS